MRAIDAALVRVEGGPKKWLMVVKNENHTPVEKNIRTLWIDNLASSLPSNLRLSVLGERIDDGHAAIELVRI